MPEIDPVIVKLTADVAKYNRDIENTTRKVSRSFNDQERSVKKLEREMSRSVDGISSSLKGLAATFAAGFGASQLAGLADSFTRIQNSLKVAGLEGARLKDVQDQLLAQSVKYGVSLEEVSRLYGGVSQAAADLGITSQQTVQITEATAQALKITGTSAAQAQGAILGLVQALSAGKVTTDEYSQMNEGGLRPLLQLAANTDKYQGSLAKLKKDLGDGVLSSRQLAEAILEGANALDEKASKAVLTLSGAMEGLNSQLVVYFGEADKANGVSEALATAIKAIADNLGTIIPIIAALTAAIGVRYVAGAMAAAGATGLLATAMATLQTAGIAALIVGLGLLINEVSKATDASDEYRKALEDSNKASGEAEKYADELASATGAARKAAIEAAKAKRDQAKADLQAAQAALIHAEAQKVLADQVSKNKPWWQQFAEGVAAGESGPSIRNLEAENSARADANVKAAQSSVINLQKTIDKLTTAINAPAPSPRSDGDEGSKRSKTKAAAKIREKQFATEAEQAAELARIDLEILQARLDQADTAEKRKELEDEILAKEKAMRIAEINANEKYTKAQKEAQIARLEALYGAPPSESGDITVSRGLYGRKIDQEMQAALTKVNQEFLRLQQEALQDAAALEPNRIKRAELERRALEIQQEIERELFKERLERGDLASLTAERKEQAQREFDASQSSARASAVQRNESPLQRRRRELNEEASNINDAVEQIQVDAMDRFADSIAGASTQFIKLGGIAGDVINGIIQDLVRLAAKQAVMGLFGGGEGGGGNILGSIGKMFQGKRASGGSVVGGVPYLVGDGGGPEVFVPHGSGTIIPNSQLRNASVSRINAAQQQPVVIKVQANDYFDAKVDSRAAPIASRAASDYSGASYAMSQRSAPSTMNKYNQLKG